VGKIAKINNKKRLASIENLEEKREGRSLNEDYL
jgi:hypothetical protein